MLTPFVRCPYLLSERHHVRFNYSLHRSISSPAEKNDIYLTKSFDNLDLEDFFPPGRKIVNRDDRKLLLKRNFNYSYSYFRTRSLGTLVTSVRVTSINIWILR